jgi:hypothetical protein
LLKTPIYFARYVSSLQCRLLCNLLRLTRIILLSEGRETALVFCPAVRTAAWNLPLYCSLLRINHSPVFCIMTKYGSLCIYSLKRLSVTYAIKEYLNEFTYIFHCLLGECFATKGTCKVADKSREIQKNLTFLNYTPLLILN